MSTTLLISLTVAVAFVSLVIGLTLFLLSCRKNFERSHTTLVLSWPFLALFIAMILFLLFPGSTSSGALFGISVSGAVALFMLAWYFGVRVSREALNLDASLQKSEAEKKRLMQELQEIKQQGVQSFKSTELSNGVPFVCQVKGRKGKKIALITGRIEEVKIADVWVSSENTDMQMARFYDRSISGVVRYRGAKKDVSGHVIDDTIAEELKARIGNSSSVSPTSIFITGSGELEHDNNVKKIFHVASVRGEAGVGYVPIENIQYCISKALKAADEEECRRLGIKSILFPLLGVGTARGSFEIIVPKLFRAAVLYFEETENSNIEYIYFLTRTDHERDACLIEFRKLAQLNKIEIIRESHL